MWAARKRRFRKDQQKTRKLICDCTSNTSKETSTVVLKKKRQSANLHESPSILHTFMYLTGCKTEAYFQWLKWAKMLRHSCRSNHTKSGKSGSVCKACMTLWAIPRIFFVPDTLESRTRQWCSVYDFGWSCHDFVLRTRFANTPSADGYAALIQACDLLLAAVNRSAGAKRRNRQIRSWRRIRAAHIGRVWTPWMDFSSRKHEQSEKCKSNASNII